MNDKNEMPDPLTQDEVTRIVLSVVTGMGKATEADMEKAVAWAREARIEESLLRCVLDGRLLIVAVEPDITFKARQS